LRERERERKQVCREISSRFKGAFFVQNFGAKNYKAERSAFVQNFGAKNALLYEKRARKMLVKSTSSVS